MKTLSKVLLSALSLSIALNAILNISFVGSFLSIMFLYGNFIFMISFYKALNIRNADLNTIKAYKQRINECSISHDKKTNKL